MNLLRLLHHPYRTKEMLRWHITKKRMKHVGVNTFVDFGFNMLNPENISIGDNTHIGPNCKINVYREIEGENSINDPIIVIGDNVTITENSFISCANSVLIGDGCLFGVNTFITDNFHGGNTLEELSIPPDKRKLVSKGPVVIGNNVWTGRNVCIMPGVTIGDGAIIGANAVVTHDIPSCSIAVGVPAIVIKTIE